MTTFNLTLSETQTSKLLDYIESMLETCDTQEERSFYGQYLDQVNSQLRSQSE